MGVNTTVAVSGEQGVEDDAEDSEIVVAGLLDDAGRRVTVAAADAVAFVAAPSSVVAAAAAVARVGMLLLPVVDRTVWNTLSALPHRRGCCCCCCSQCHHTDLPYLHFQHHYPIVTIDVVGVVNSIAGLPIRQSAVAFRLGARGQ